MAEPTPIAAAPGKASPPGLGPAHGPFVEIDAGIWVNASQVAAVVPIDSMKGAKGETTQDCRVYITGPSIGGGHILAWNAPRPAATMVVLLVDALGEWASAEEECRERGRIQALDVAGVADDD
jgi:hypothetical protein